MLEAFFEAAFEFVLITLEPFFTNKKR